MPTYDDLPGWELRGECAHRAVRIDDRRDGLFLHPTPVLEALLPEAGTLSWTIFDPGSFWIVSAADRVLDRLARVFTSVSEVDPHTASLSTWGRE